MCTNEYLLESGDYPQNEKIFKDKNVDFCYIKNNCDSVTKRQTAQLKYAKNLTRH